MMCACVSPGMRVCVLGRSTPALVDSARTVELTEC